MGQGPSHRHEDVYLETRVEEPSQQPLSGLALVAHGRLGGDFNQPVVRQLAEYLCKKRNLRVITWNERATGNSGGSYEWWDVKNHGQWIGDEGVYDYNRLLHEAMRKYASDFPEARDAELWICGYSTGAMFAGCVRPPPDAHPFALPRYVLVSYPVEFMPVLAMERSSFYYRSVEALVQGDGWEGLPSEFQGKEPSVAGVLIVTAGKESWTLYRAWAATLRKKNNMGNLKQVIVHGTGHAWTNMAHKVVEEVEKWVNS